MHLSEVRVHYAALLVALLKASMLDAADALEEWGTEWLDVDPDELDELLELDDQGEPRIRGGEGGVNA